MRCSSCSDPVVPLIAVDIDGTLGDYHGHFQNFAREYLGPPFDHPLYDPYLHPGFRYGGKISHAQYYQEVFGIDLRTFRDIKLAYRQGAQKRSMTVFPGAKEFIDKLHTMDLEVWLTTTRPYLRLDGVDPDTRAWLTRNEIRYDGLLYDEDKYQVLARRVEPGRVVAVLDDLPEQYDAAQGLFGRGAALLRGTPYNARVRRDFKVESFSVALEHIDALVNNWRSRHGRN